MLTAKANAAPSLKSITMQALYQIRWFALTLFVLIIDQVSKYWAEHVLGWAGRVELLPIFDLSLAHNRGAAFGFLADAGGWQQVFFATLAILISTVLLVAMKRLQAHQRHLAIAYALVIGGALGNLIDRLLYQYVIDFIHVFYQNAHFPHFNIADSAIFIGAVLLIFDAFEKPFLDRSI